ncbi:hypothetical protein [Streptomyces sp. NPDC003952]
MTWALSPRSTTALLPQETTFTGFWLPRPAAAHPSEWRRGHDILWQAWKAIELPEDAEAHGSEDGIGIKAAAVQVIVEVVPPGSERHYTRPHPQAA